MSEYDVLLDTSGLSCPMPVMKTKKALRELKSGQVLNLIATDPASVDDVKTMLKGSSDTILELKEEGGKYLFFIKRG